MFHRCSTLPLLIISDNDITSIGTEFTDMIHLKVLHLERNRIIHIQIDAFFTVTGLEELFLCDNYLAVIKQGMFAGLGALELLDLSRNNIETIEKKSFEYLVNLTKLDLSGNSFTELHMGVFEGLNNLFDLVLAKNNIQEIEPGSFVGLGRVRILELGSNNLTILQKYSFFGAHLKVGIFLCSNNIQFIEPLAFGYPKHVTLYLDGDTVSSLEWNTFRVNDTLSGGSWKPNYVINVCQRSFSCDRKHCWMRLRNNVKVIRMRGNETCDWTSTCVDKGK